MCGCVRVSDKGSEWTMDAVGRVWWVAIIDGTVFCAYTLNDREKSEQKRRRQLDIIIIIIHY